MLAINSKTRFIANSFITQNNLMGDEDEKVIEILGRELICIGMDS